MYVNFWDKKLLKMTSLQNGPKTDQEKTKKRSICTFSDTGSSREEALPHAQGLRVVRPPVLGPQASREFEDPQRSLVGPLGSERPQQVSYLVTCTAVGPWFTWS